MTAAALIAAGVILVQAPAPQTFEIRPGPVDQAVNTLAAQAGIDVVIGAHLRGRRTRGLSGRMTAEAALDRLLAPVGARAVRIGERMYRIEAAPVRPGGPPRPIDTPDATQLSEVVVTAMPPVGVTTAAGRSLIDPGALERVDGRPASDAVADLSAQVDSTRQGTGRNKLFIRGLADSVINGPVQATVGQYFGDLRLSFGSPDPDLAMVDIARVEVFEGPQGSRFGAGSIGGVLRVHPRPPVLGENSARVLAGVGSISGGGDGGEGQLVANLALGDQSAARMAVYGRRDAGYVNEPYGKRERDSVDTVGARIALRHRPGEWTFDAVGIVQRVEAADAQVSGTGDRWASEPYRSSLVLAGLTAQRRFGPSTMTWASSLSSHRLDERFDATQPAATRPTLVDRRQDAVIAASELRIDMVPAGRWTLSGGAAIAVGETVVERRREEELVYPTTQVQITKLRRTFAEATGYGEASVSPAENWRLSLGARLSVSQIDSVLRATEFATLGGRDDAGTAVRLTPSVSMRWNVSPRAALFARFEQTVRPAGVGEANGAFQRYNGDRVTLAEIGARSRREWKGMFGEVSAGWADWRDVQADIVTPGGELAIDNVGDGLIYFVSLKGAWRPIPMLDVSGSLFVNGSTLTPTRVSIIGAGRTDIPNVAPVGAQLSVSHDAGRLGGLPLNLAADLRYVGQSRLGVGPALDVPQGGYLRSELTARLGDDRRAATLRVSNPFNTEGVRYGIGSPYRLFQSQPIPVQPLTVRLTFEAAF